MILTDSVEGGGRFLESDCSSCSYGTESSLDGVSGRTSCWAAIERLARSSSYGSPTFAPRSIFLVRSVVAQRRGLTPISRGSTTFSSFALMLGDIF